MDLLSRRIYEKLLQQLTQRTIRGNRYKVSLYTTLDGDQLTLIAPPLIELEGGKTKFAFSIMFERNNAESAWRLVTPLTLTD